MDAGLISSAGGCDGVDVLLPPRGPLMPAWFGLAVSVRLLELAGNMEAVLKDYAPTRLRMYEATNGIVFSERRPCQHSPVQECTNRRDLLPHNVRRRNAG